MTAKPAYAQPDLFGEYDIAQRATVDTERHLKVDALSCLRDSVPEALEVVLFLSYRHERDTRNPRASGDWAYCICRPGLRYERRDHWSRPTDGGRSGWDRTPTHLITWPDLFNLVGTDARRADLETWRASLTAPDRWRDLTRPFELWPQPEAWHPSYIQGDHARPGWSQRIDAWRTAQTILNDAIEELTA